MLILEIEEIRKLNFLKYHATVLQKLGRPKYHEVKNHKNHWFIALFVRGTSDFEFPAGQKLGTLAVKYAFNFQTDRN